MGFKVFKLISNTIQSFDSFPVPVSLLIKGESDVKNFFGGLLTLISFIWSLYLTWDTIVDFYFSTNPTVVTNIEYDVDEDTLNGENFFVSLSFFAMKENGKSLSDKSNDLNRLLFLNNLTYSCENCTDSNNQATPIHGNVMNLCSDSYYNNITISGLSKKKSKGIIDIFTSYSYCLPDGTKTVIKNSVDSNLTDMEYSLKFDIPTQKTPIKIDDLPKNTREKKSIKDDLKVEVKAPVSQPEEQKEIPEEKAEVNPVKKSDDPPAPMEGSLSSPKNQDNGEKPSGN